MKCPAKIYLLIYLGEEPGLVKTSSEGLRGCSLCLKIGYPIELCVSCVCEHSSWIEMEKMSKTRERQVQLPMILNERPMVIGFWWKVNTLFSGKIS